MGGNRLKIVLGAGLAAFLGLLIARFTFGTQGSQELYARGRNNTVLILSTSENGLSNVHVATSFALAENYPDLEVHYASFPILQSEIERVSAYAQLRNPESQGIIWHGIARKAYGDAFALEFGITNITGMITPPGLNGIRKFVRSLGTCILPWGTDDYLDIFRDVESLIGEIDPAVVVLDTVFAPAIDATRQLNRLHAFVSPNALADVMVASQPYAAMLWKYPALGSGYPYPLPWHLIPANVIATGAVAYGLLFAPELETKRRQLRAQGISNPADFLTLHRPDVPWISAQLKEASLPFSYMPPNVTECGPIVISAASAEDQDPELAAWLSGAPTILVNLGSATIYDANTASIMAASLKPVLESTDAQILWKMKTAQGLRNGTSPGTPIPPEALKPIQEYIENGRVRIEKWLNVDPAAILDTGHVVATVHHGGANCFFEGIRSGVPHVVIPAWVDLYAFARLAEYLGVGVYANKDTAPSWTVDGLSTAFLRILDGGPEAQAMAAKAQELGRIAKKEEGRNCAARKVVELARNR